MQRLSKRCWYRRGKRGRYLSESLGPQGACSQRSLLLGLQTAKSQSATAPPGQGSGTSGHCWVCNVSPRLFRAPGDRRELTSVLVPYRLHGAACNDHCSAFLHHLGKVHSWIQEQEFEAALTNIA